MSDTHTSIIILIATVVLAASAATMINKSLIDTKDRAKKVADDNIAKTIGNSMKMIEVYARSTSPRTFSYIYPKVKIEKGSEPQNLENLMLYFNTGNSTRGYSYNENINCKLSPDESSDESNIANINNSEKFGAYFSIRRNPDLTDEPVVHDEDIVVLCAKTPRKVKDTDYIVIGLYPELASDTTVGFYVPNVFPGEYFPIYPPTGSVY